MNKKDILELPIYKNQVGKYLTKKDIVSNFPHNFKIKEGLEYEYATTSGTTSDRMEIIRKPNWFSYYFHSIRSCSRSCSIFIL